MSHVTTTETAAHPRPAVQRSGGVNGEIIFLWVAILLALAFWAPLTFIVDSGILAAG